MFKSVNGIKKSFTTKMNDAVMCYAGTSKIDVSPPVGYFLQGHAARNKPSQKIHDPLYLKVLTVSKGKNRLVIITADLVYFSPEFVKELRKEVKNKLGIPAQNLFLNASHTHTGPLMFEVPYCREKPLSDYLTLLQKKIIGGIIEAINDEEKVRLKYGKGEVDIGIINRRKKTKEGVLMLPNPEGTVDKEVSVLRVDKENNHPKAILFNYSCHPTTLSTNIFEISGDYPGITQREIEKMYPHAVALFTQGCSGDVRPAIIKENKFSGGEFKDIERMGKILAGEVIKVCEMAKEFSPEFIKGKLKTVNLPLDKSLLPINKKKLEEAYSLYLKQKNVPISHLDEWKKYWQDKIGKKEKIPEHIKGDVQVFNVGEVNIIGLPGEIMVEIGIKIKEKIRKAIVCGYSNGVVGYIPTAIASKEGGYETRSFLYRKYSAPFALGIEEVLINNVLKMGVR